MNSGSVGCNSTPTALNLFKRDTFIAKEWELVGNSKACFLNLRNLEQTRM